MPDKYLNFDETTDQYLQILREAQRVEDKKLVEMIRSRLKQKATRILATGSGCEIIMFPRTWAPSMLLRQERQLWPRQPVAQGLALCGSYCFSVLLSLLLGLG
ncbi:MAG: hypothetical protein PVH87_25050 [Desulfobacteraceae bacterium]